MDITKIRIYPTSEEYLKRYQKRTKQIALFWSFLVVLTYYSLWASIVLPIKQISSSLNTIEILSAFNPLTTQEECIAFALLAILPAVIASVIIFKMRSKQFERLETMTIKITPEELVQEFQEEVYKKLLWKQVDRVHLFTISQEQILYIELYGANDTKIRVYGVDSWSELINNIKEICESKNIKLGQGKARLGAKGSLEGAIPFDTLLIITLTILLPQLGVLKLYLYADTLFIVFIILSCINIAFFIEPLNINRSKYRYHAIYTLIACLTFALFMQWVNKKYF
jgi:hypothetical protein